MPVAVTGPAKAVIDETFPYYAGIYNGKASQPYTIEAIEGYRRPAAGTACRGGLGGHHRRTRRQRLRRHTPAPDPGAVP